MMKRLPLILLGYTLLLAFPAAAGGREPPATTSATSRAGLLQVQVNARPLGLPPRQVIVPEVQFDVRSQGPWWIPAPEHIEVQFGRQSGGIYDYKATVLRVYPVKEYERLHAQVQPNPIQVEVVRLRDVLREGFETDAKPLPYLPLINAWQALHAAPKRLNFHGGSGVRYLTAYNQDLVPFTRGRVFYTFQGITDDGKYYVSFTAPANPAVLPTHYEDVPESDYSLGGGASIEAENKAFAAYAARVTRQLNTLTNDVSLTKFDAVIRSLSIR